MPLPIKIPHYFIQVVFFVFPHFLFISYSNPRISEPVILCGTSQPHPGSNYIPNIIDNVDILADLVTKQHWGYHNNSPLLTVYSLAQCFEDLTNTDCFRCFEASRKMIPRCLPSTSARLYLDGCFLRYDNYSFFNESVDPDRDTIKCTPLTGVESKEYMKMEFAVKVKQVIKNATETAVMHEGFGVEEVKRGVVRVYALAQCWKTLSKEQCRTCLAKAEDAVGGCVPKMEGRALNAGCYLKYSTEKFYNEGAETKKQRLSQKTIIAIIILSATTVFMLSLIGACVGYSRLSQMTEEQHNSRQLSSTVNNTNLNFKYETLEKATDFFDPSRKIGQGGAGSVFKGTLPDGRIVAVKRLVFNTRQWVDLFFNEVNLISGIQHKNLVQLLGCSIEGPESLLVYEYIPNKSLDQFLFDKKNTKILSWQQRSDIIVGTAEGLAFLHGRSQVRIIHRDIKSSNILLDENFNAKIADFGLARCFGTDKTHLSTGIAGTLGYMAPEYLVRGQLTDKADVYSFGVLVLEIICGKKNNVFTQETSSVLQKVWNYYKSNRLTESVDPCLRGDFPAIEAVDLLKVGLLCTQASVSLRPSMIEVVQMLTDKEYAVPLPKQPPFLNSSVLGPDTSTRSTSTSSSASNVASIIEMSYASTDTSYMTGSESDGPSRTEISEQM